MILHWTETTDIVCSKSNEVVKKTINVNDKLTTEIIKLERTSKIVVKVTPVGKGIAQAAFGDSKVTTSTFIVSSTSFTKDTATTLNAGYLSKGTYYIFLNENNFGTTNVTVTITQD